jgi:hypothetical protein
MMLFSHLAEFCPHFIYLTTNLIYVSVIYTLKNETLKYAVIFEKKRKKMKHENKL